MNQTTEPRPNEKNWPLFIGGALTFIWILGIGFLLDKKWYEFIGLSLNALGDTFAGIAAPLAFLWLVVATFIQRKELELQREELKLARKENSEARDIFEKQRTEMRAAAESAEKQARILTDTYKLDRMAAEITILNSLLYNYAEWIKSNNKKIILKVLKNSHYILISLYDPEDTPRSSAENLYFSFSQRLISIVERLNTDLNCVEQGEFFDSFISKLTLFQNGLKTLDKDNPVVALKIAFLDIQKLDNAIVKLMAVVTK